MKRKFVVAATAGLAALAWLAAQVAPGTGTLAAIFPSGPVLYLEARDFSGLLRDWSGSNEKKLWLASGNYEFFSRSRLFLRLQQAQGEFAQAAGLAPDMLLVDAVAGTQSAVAIYDIGALHFLYVARLATANAMATALWQTRTSYESRSTAGKEYFVRSGPNNRVAAFAAAEGYLLLATREDLMAGALALLSKQQRPSLPSETWYSQGARAGQTQGELRLVLNVPGLLQSTHFRSYWVQRNASELKPFASGVVDFFREGSQWREERSLLRDVAAPARTAEEAAVARVAAWVPDGTILYRAWARPSAAFIANLVDTKILSPGVHAVAPVREAPPAANLDVVTGSESDLETRIDQPALPSVEQAPDTIAILKIFEGTGIEAAVHIQSSRPGPDGAFIGNESAIGLLGAADWQVAALRPLLGAAHVQASGRALAIASTSAMLARVTARLNTPPAPVRGIYSAQYQHRLELPHFEPMMRMIDQSRSPGRGDPAFFTGSVASLGRVLNRVQSQSVVFRDDGTAVRQQVLYRLAP